MNNKKIDEVARLRAAGKKYKEIADLTGLPVGTVKTMIHRVTAKKCEACGKPLDGKKERFCSDFCTPEDLEQGPAREDLPGLREGLFAKGPEANLLRARMLPRCEEEARWRRGMRPRPSWPPFPSPGGWRRLGCLPPRSSKGPKFRYAKSMVSKTIRRLFESC